MYIIDDKYILETISDGKDFENIIEINCPKDYMSRGIVNMTSVLLILTLNSQTAPL